MEEYNCKKELIGCLGYPVWENPTGDMIQPAFDELDKPYLYITTEVSADKLKDCVLGLKAQGYKGWNCTIPHKVAVIEHLDALGESAKIIGAVNCVVEREGQYIGENTDGKGFMESLNSVIDPVGKKALIFGAGGAARAIAVETALAGVTEILVVNRSAERGQTLVDLINNNTPAKATLQLWEGECEIPAGTDIVINATSIGLYPNVNERVAVNKAGFTKDMVVCDVIPNPPKTIFLIEAKEAGCTILDGMGMLVNQGKIGFEYWTGKEANTALMRGSLEKLFG
jgi:shikimate dehydrogenase